MASHSRELARALMKFTDEHGAPNSVSPGELHSDGYTDLTSLEIGACLHNENVQLAEELATRGLRLAGYESRQGRKAMLIEQRG